nr:hypothetical protein [Acinetobacter sp. Marseille-Q1620]
MLLADYDVYKNATKSELTPTTEALLYSTIKKIALIKGFEGKIGGDYKVDKDLNIAEKNQFCWIGNFVQQYKKYIPAQIDKSDVLNWVDKKQMDIKAELRDLNGDKMIENDCRAIN